MRKKTENYNIGIDIGTASVGYAVTDGNGNNIKIKGKNMWGVNLFDSANTAVSTRTARGMRRRYDRKRQRIKLLREFFVASEEIDNNFFEKLDASYLNEKSNGFNIFDEQLLNDKSYYAQFRTIYHLRKYLQTCEEKADIRLIYLALHHIVKYRGNFLYEDNPKLSAENADVSASVEQFFNSVGEIFSVNYTAADIENFTNVLNDTRLSKKDKNKSLKKIFGVSVPGKNLSDAILGYKTNFSAIFNPDADKADFKITDDEKRDAYMSTLDDTQSGLIDALFNLNSAIVLQDILFFDKNNNDSDSLTLSDAMINKYNEYGKDLSDLKDLVRKYYKNEYKYLFGKKLPQKPEKEKAENPAYDKFCQSIIFKDVSEGKNYTNYDLGAKKCSLDDFYSTIKKLFPLDSKEYEFSSDDKYLRMKTRIENGDFLKKINSTDNSAIPYQLHLEELRNIIDNQGKYYPFLLENKEKISSIVSFRLPYWCGPLNAKKNPEGSRQFAWSERKIEGQKIYPWNFEEIIDIDKTAEKFIKTLTNYCTYLPSEKVLPKYSLLYSEYALRNEIFSINIGGISLDSYIRQNLFDEFCRGRNSMNARDLEKWLSVSQKIDISKGKIKGYQGDGKFANNMKSFNDFTKILGEINANNYSDIEKMIYYLTVYNDKRIIRRRISNEFSYLTDKQITAISNLKYSGWGALSGRLLNGISIEENGCSVTVIDKMRTGRWNFMQIINQKQFKSAIEKEASYDIGDNINEIINGLPGSPSIKKGIRQSIAVINEIVSIMGAAPDNIFVEFARDDEESIRKKSRQKQMLKKYEEFKNNPDFSKVYNEIKKLDEKDFDDRMIYLYCLQNGKSLYSNRELDITALSQTCQVDHILPRCYIKDDSFDNLALVLSGENQNKKDDLLISKNIIDTQKGHWENLKRAGLMSDKKFNNLSREKIRESDYNHFINRQLVETRQITKHVANILKELYSPQGTDIVQIKASLSSDLRSRFGLYKNRDINDFHHAHDAFIACQIGIFTQKCLPGVYKDFDFNTVKHYFAIKDKTSAKKNKYGFVIGKINDIFTNSDGEVIWNGEEQINKIIKALDYKDCFISKKAEAQSGKFYKDTIYAAGSKDAKIPRKENMPVELYGGMTGIEEAYCVIIEYTKGKKRVRKLVGIPIVVDTQSKTKPNAITDYLASQGYADVKIQKNRICKYQKMLIDGQEYYLSSSSEVHNARQLILPAWANRVLNKPTEDDKDSLTAIYDLLIEKINKFYPGFQNIAEKLHSQKQHELFASLGINEKVQVLTQILIMLHANASNAKLNAIGLTDREGRKNGFSVEVDNTVFIFTSVTGIYEKQIKGSDLWDSAQL